MNKRIMTTSVPFARLALSPVTRLPSESALIASTDYCIKQLERIRVHAGDLLRRRRFDAGRDGYPSSSMGGGSNTGRASSSTEIAALSGPLPDPIARYIDAIIEAVAEADGLMQQAGNCLHNVLSAESEVRGRQSSVVECDACHNPVTGIGDDRRRSGFCPACYKAWTRYRSGAQDPTRAVFIIHRRDSLETTA